MKPKRIQRRRAKGWKLPPNTVIVDRTSKWGNPFVIGKHGDREQCLRSFDMLCAGNICLCKEPSIDAQRAYLKMAVRDIEELRGKDVACFCTEGTPCHGDTLIRAANKRRRRKPA